MPLTARSLAGYTVAVAVLVSSGVALVLTPYSGVALLIAGILLLPVTLRGVSQTTEIQMTTWGVVFVAIVLLAAGSTGVVTDISGHPPDIRYEYQWESFVGASYQPHVIVTGEVVNNGEGGLYNGYVTAKVLDGDGGTITEGYASIGEVPAETSEMFYVKFELSQTQFERLDDVTVSVNTHD